MGVRVARVMTDDGSCYKSHAFKTVCAELGIRHIRTKPYTPKTNGGDGGQDQKYPPAEPERKNVSKACSSMIHLIMSSFGEMVDGHVISTGILQTHAEFLTFFVGQMLCCC